MSPRSLPYEEEFSLTRKISRTPCSTSQAASALISAGWRETYAPRNAGIAQKVQRRSQPGGDLQRCRRTAVEPATEYAGPACRSHRLKTHEPVPGDGCGVRCCWACRRRQRQ